MSGITLVIFFALISPTQMHPLSMSRVEWKAHLYADTVLQTRLTYQTPSGLPLSLRSFLRKTRTLVPIIYFHRLKQLRSFLDSLLPHPVPHPSIQMLWNYILYTCHYRTLPFAPSHFCVSPHPALLRVLLLSPPHRPVSAVHPFSRPLLLLGPLSFLV